MRKSSLSLSSFFLHFSFVSSILLVSPVFATEVICHTDQGPVAHTDQRYIDYCALVDELTGIVQDEGEHTDQIRAEIKAIINSTGDHTDQRNAALAKVAESADHTDQFRASVANVRDEYLLAHTDQGSIPSTVALDTALDIIAASQDFEDDLSDKLEDLLDHTDQGLSVFETDMDEVTAHTDQYRGFLIAAENELDHTDQ